MVDQPRRPPPPGVDPWLADLLRSDRGIDKLLDLITATIGRRRAFWIYKKAADKLRGTF